MMTALSGFAKRSDRWANELWNVSLLPVTAANESASFPPRPSTAFARGGSAEPDRAGERLGACLGADDDL